MDTQKTLASAKLNVAKPKVAESDIAPVVNELAQKVDQLDGIIRCLSEQQYDFNKKLKQIDVLIGQGNGVLMEDDESKLDHLNSLTKLAEKTIVEADKIAESIRKEIEEKAHVEAAHIIAKAEEKAQKEAEKMIAEAREKARKAASQEAESILGGINDIKGIFDKAYQNVLSNLSTSDE